MVSLRPDKAYLPAFYVPVCGNGVIPSDLRCLATCGGIPISALWKKGFPQPFSMENGKNFQTLDFDGEGGRGDLFIYFCR